MSETKIDGKPVRPVPENIPEELVPVYQWIVDNGKDVLIQAAVVVIVFIAALSFVKYRAARAETASASLLSANDVAGLEDLDGRFGGTKVGPLIRLRLARARYDAGQFPEAAETYAAFLKSNRGHALAAEAKLGLAASLEAQGKFDEASAEYAGAAGEGMSPRYVAAKMGQARCLAGKGDRAGAEETMAALAKSVKGTVWEDAVEQMKGVVDRFDGFRKSATIFDQMNALQNALAPADAADVAADAAADAAAPAAPAPEAPAAAAPAAPEAPAPAAPEAPAAAAPAPAAPEAPAAPAAAAPAAPAPEAPAAPAPEAPAAPAAPAAEATK